MRDVTYPPIIVTAKTAFRALGQRFQMTGTEHVPREGGVLLAFNHIGYVDFIYGGFAANPSGRLVRFMSKRELFDHRWVGPLMRSLHHIEVDRGEGVASFHTAVDYLRRHVRRCSSGFLPVTRHLVTTVPWWDTVDLLAAHVVGALVAADPALAAEMDRWSADDDLWLVRTALLHQLRHKERTDTDRLFHYCLRQSGHPDFFVRKAIGWALREYAKTDPDAVRDLLAREGDRFAPLSVREALKNIGA